MWIQFAILYIVTTYFLCFYKKLVTNLVPNIIYKGKLTTSSDYLPRLPKDQSTVIKTYDIWVKNEPDKLDQVSKLLNFNFTSNEQLYQLVTELRQATEENSSGLAGKFWRMLNFVNFIWIISILGMTITFLPFLIKIAGPLFAILGKVLVELIKLLVTYYEEIGYSLLTFFLVQSFHFHKDIGFYIAFTTLCGYCGLFIHSLSVHEKNTVIDKELANVFTYSMMFVPTVLLTLSYDSYFLGFLSVAIFYAMIGFSVVSRGLCWCIGFDNMDSLTNCIGASLVLIPLYFSLDGSVSYLKYFHYGTYCFGVIVYFLALLIMSSRFHSRNGDHVRAQLTMIFSLVVSMGYGSFYNISSLFNVGATFVCLYFGEKIGEMEIWKGSEIVLIFLGFVSCYYASLWLNTHPAFLMSVISGKD